MELLSLPAFIGSTMEGIVEAFARFARLATAATRAIEAFGRAFGARP